MSNIQHILKFPGCPQMAFVAFFPIPHLSSPPIKNHPHKIKIRSYFALIACMFLRFFNLEEFSTPVNHDTDFLKGFVARMLHSEFDYFLLMSLTYSFHRISCELEARCKALKPD